MYLNLETAAHNNIIQILMEPQEPSYGYANINIYYMIYLCEKLRTSRIYCI